MVFIERETQNFILKFRKIFSYGEKQCSEPAEWNLTKSHFSVKFMWLFEKKWYMLWLTGIFALFLKGLKIFLNPRLSLIVSLNDFRLIVFSHSCFIAHLILLYNLYSLYVVQPHLGSLPMLHLPHLSFYMYVFCCFLWWKQTWTWT